MVLDKQQVQLLDFLRHLVAKLDLILNMNSSQINDILSKISNSPSKWELDTVVYYDRASNLETLTKFLTRIQQLQNSTETATVDEMQELAHLLDLLDDMEEEDCLNLIGRSDEEVKHSFIENLARTSAIEILTGGKISFTTMNTACKLSPNDFILCAKRTQDLINAVQGLVVKGETLSMDVAGA